MADTTLLGIKNLSISFGKRNDFQEVVHKVSFDIPENKVVGLVGESGSGKSVTAMAIMGLLPQGQSLISGEILFSGQDLLKLDRKSLRSLRGNQIGMIFQEPMSALNPSLKCGIQVAEVLKLHLNYNNSRAKKETISLFKKVKLPRPEAIYSSYPHQISGGQMQRVMIAMAIACKPKLLIADEPTTALDVTVQKEILQLLKELQEETGMSMLFISHDLNLVSEIADRVVVMFRGDKVEEGSVFQIFKTPSENYTKALLASRPTLEKRLKELPTISSIADGSFKAEEVSSLQRAKQHKKLYTQAPLLEVRQLHKDYYSSAGLFRSKQPVRAVNDVSFAIFEGETVGLVGESGCGKSTLGKSILLLEKATSGSILYRGKEITTLNPRQVRELRKDIQLIFQDPYSSLNPRLQIGRTLEEAMLVHQIGTSAKNRRERIKTLLERVGLGEDFTDRYPHELSGGQRQRVGIARTVALQPKLVVCDESVSALDISVQAQVLNLLNELKEDYGFTYLFISHDLSVVKYMADQLLVMNEGRLEEVGDADEIYANPQKEYTRKLIDAIPKGIQ